MVGGVALRFFLDVSRYGVAYLCCSEEWEFLSVDFALEVSGGVIFLEVGVV